MSSYAQCWLGAFYVGSSRNDIDPFLIQLFRPSDKKVVKDLTSQVPSHLGHWMDELSEYPDTAVVYYSTSSTVICERLNLMGYTLENARSAFDEYLKCEVAFYEKSFEERYREMFEQKLSILRPLTVDS